MTISPGGLRLPFIVRIQTPQLCTCYSASSLHYPLFNSFNLSLVRDLIYSNLRILYFMGLFVGCRASCNYWCLLSSHINLLASIHTFCTSQFIVYGGNFPMERIPLRRAIWILSNFPTFGNCCWPMFVIRINISAQIARDLRPSVVIFPSNVNKLLELHHNS